jgi:hypothetical protein
MERVGPKYYAWKEIHSSSAGIPINVMALLWGMIMIGCGILALCVLVFEVNLGVFDQRALPRWSFWKQAAWWTITVILLSVGSGLTYKSARGLLTFDRIISRFANDSGGRQLLRKGDRLAKEYRAIQARLSVCLISERDEPVSSDADSNPDEVALKRRCEKYQLEAIRLHRDQHTALYRIIKHTNRPDPLIHGCVCRDENVTYH